jgi:citrate lyase synthetase
MVIEKVNLKGCVRNQIEEFLRGFGLQLDVDVEYTAVAKINDDIVGTCSYAGKVLKCFAVKEELQGEGIAAKLVTHITDRLFELGIYETFIFTKETALFSDIRSCNDLPPIAQLSLSSSSIVITVKSRSLPIILTIKSVITSISFFF